MFTGIITNLGKVMRKENMLFTFQVEETFCKKIENGTSVAINGVCLTVCEKTRDTFSISVMPETMRKTMFDDLQSNAIVNLELPVTPETFLSGHIVQGHVDGVGKVKSIEVQKNSKILTIEIKSTLNGYIVEKGSIAINGISLTVITVSKTKVVVGIIPYTWEHTMLHTVGIGDRVNIETDILAKYIEKLFRKEDTK